MFGAITDLLIFLHNVLIYFYINTRSLLGYVEHYANMFCRVSLRKKKFP